MGGWIRSPFFGSAERSSLRRPSLFVSVGCCVVAFFCGLLFVQRSGNYFVTMFDDYSAGLPLTVVVIMENLSVAWIYGTKRCASACFCCRVQ